MPHKETRKIIQVGNSLAVTIPKSWLRFHELTQSDRVEVISDGSVTITPRKSKKPTKEA